MAKQNGQTPGFFQRRSQKIAQGSRPADLSNFFRQQYPNLAEMLVGCPDPEKPTEWISFSLNLYSGDAGLSFALRRRGSDEAWFGTSLVEDDVLVSVEKAISSGEITMKREKNWGKGATH